MNVQAFFFGGRALFVLFVAVIKGNKAELIGIQPCRCPVVDEARDPGLTVATPGAEEDFDFGVV